MIPLIPSQESTVIYQYAHFFDSISLSKVGKKRLRKLHDFSYIRPAVFIYVTLRGPGTFHFYTPIQSVSINDHVSKEAGPL